MGWECWKTYVRLDNQHIRVKAMTKLLEKLGIDFDTFKSIDSDNSKLKTTVFNGMRKR